MAGYIGSKASVTVTSPETDSRYVNTSGDTMTSDLDVEGNITSDNGNGNFVSLTTDGAVEILRSNGEGYIDFKGSHVDFDCRIAQYSNGLQFTTGGSGAPVSAMTMDSSGRIGIGNTSPTETLAVRTYGNSEISTQYGTGIKARLGAYSNGSRVSVATGSVDFDLASEVGATDTVNLRAYYNGTWKRGLQMNPDGHIATPNQPLCITANNAAWLNMLANNSYGIHNTGAGFIANRGGFYAGGTLGGYNVVHVPATGFYRIGLSLYVAANNDGRRVYVKKNDATDICFIQTTQSTVDNTQYAEGIIEMTAGDYLNYHVIFGDVNSYHNNHHTYVKIEYLG